MDLTKIYLILKKMMMKYLKYLKKELNEIYKLPENGGVNIVPSVLK